MKSGVTITTAPRARSIRSSSSCARNSATTEASRGTSSQSTGWDISWCCNDGFKSTNDGLIGVVKEEQGKSKADAAATLQRVTGQNLGENERAWRHGGRPAGTLSSSGSTDIEGIPAMESCVLASIGVSLTNHAPGF